MANEPLESIKFPGIPDTFTVPAVDNTLAVQGAPADAKKVGDEISDLKADLSEIVPGLSDEAKAALLACFAKVAWIDEHGQDYYDALEAALDAETPIEVITMTNMATYGWMLAVDNNYYAKRGTGITARCIFDPIRNNTSVVAVADASKYSVACYNLHSNKLTTFMPQGEESSEQGYLMSTDVAPTFVKVVKASGTYFACSFKKEDGTDFTNDEINNAEGTIFVIGKQSNIVAWNGTEANTSKWVDNNNIIGIDNPKDLALVTGVSVSGGCSVDSSYPVATAKRATSLSQALIGDFDGKKISLTNYTLSTGAQINFALWYGYLTSNNTYQGEQVISLDNAVTARQWLSSEVTLPIDSQNTGTRIILFAFKMVNLDREFTQAELLEIPTLIQIS